jgi:sulfide:quinone oxidoreductase
MADMEERPNVLIAGGGVAALEALMALRDFGGRSLRITLVAPEECFEFRAHSALAALGAARSVPHGLSGLAADFGAGLISGRLLQVRAEAGEVWLDQGRMIGFDMLLVAVGARRVPPYPDAVTLGAVGGAEHLARLEGERLAFVVPPGVGWTLPLYEAALLTARTQQEQIFFVTSEERPLELFGPHASATVSDLLAEAGVEFIGSSHPDVAPRSISLRPSGRRLQDVRVVTLARPIGPALPGLAHDAMGFIPVDELARVRGTENVYAAGDVTTFPLKQGGLAAQQAVAAAAAIAGRLGRDVEVQPFHPVLRGALLTGLEPQWLRGGEISPEALWWPPTKVATRYLSAYLYSRDGDALEVP